MFLIIPMKYIDICIIVSGCLFLIGSLIHYFDGYPETVTNVSELKAKYSTDVIINTSAVDTGYYLRSGSSSGEIKTVYYIGELEDSYIIMGCDAGKEKLLNGGEITSAKLTKVKIMGIVRRYSGDKSLERLKNTLREDWELSESDFEDTFTPYMIKINAIGDDDIEKYRKFIKRLPIFAIAWTAIGVVIFIVRRRKRKITE